jgi:pimeloyl-ACP methyl ester carboxylesterase
VNGLGSQCINMAVEWCKRYVAEGYRVIRLDNRDVGLSSKLEGAEYSLSDMADDVVAVLDAEAIQRSHVLGVSMGGMIVQRLAISHADRLLTMTSVMSRTGEPGYGESTPEALAFLLAPPATSRSEYIDNHVAAIRVYGSKPEWIDEEETRARAAAAYDRCFCPSGVGRQMVAVMRDGSRDEELRRIDVPALVIHGSRDGLVQPDGGRHTAEVIPGARYVEIEGMGHDYPRAVWDRWVAEWSTFAADHRAAAPSR